MSTSFNCILLLLTLVLGVQCQEKRGFDCRVHVQSYSGYTEACHTASEGNLQLNSDTVWKAGWCSGSPNNRGINTFILDPRTCRTSDFRTFDTHGNPEAAADLVAYLEWIRDGAVVIGISGDEPVYRLAAVQRTLRAAGVNVGDVQYRGNFAFLLQKGFPEKTRVSKHSSVTPSVITVVIRGSKASNDYLFLNL